MAEIKDMKEKTAIDELKKRMKGDMEEEMSEDDNLFYRFLKARDFKVSDAEYMLREHLKWKKNFNINELSSCKFPEVLEQYPIAANLGFDKEGSLLKYQQFSKIDFRGLSEACTSEEWDKYVIYNFEKDILELKKHSEKLGKTVVKFVYITDMENLSLAACFDKKLISKTISTIYMYMNNYPETLKRINVINVPTYFHVFYSVLKSILPNTVTEKVKIYSDDSFKRDLLQTIDAEVLPAFLGGKRLDPDGNPLCRTVVKTPQPVPKHYYLHNQPPFSSLPDVEKLTVTEAEVHEMSLEIKNPGSHLKWEFQLRSGEIKFGILYQNDKGEKSEVVPIKRLKTKECTESGSYRCENTGIYVAVFDNSYNHSKPKEIYYKITINNPQEIMNGSTT